LGTEDLQPLHMKNQAIYRLFKGTVAGDGFQAHFRPFEPLPTHPQSKPKKSAKIA
jgi:hypothetical protein